MKLRAKAVWRLDAEVNTMWHAAKSCGVSTDCIEVLEPFDEYDEDRVARVTCVVDPHREPHRHDLSETQFMAMLRVLPQAQVWCVMEGRTGDESAATAWASLGDIPVRTGQSLGQGQGETYFTVAEETVNQRLKQRVGLAIETLVGDQEV